VNCVAPGMVRSEVSARLADSVSDEQLAAIEMQHPLGFGSTVDVAHAIAYLLADTGRWITGSTLVIDGGYLAR
jgi:3-oxoacyl-[acyl-carrier protein] reductase